MDTEKVNTIESPIVIVDDTDIMLSLTKQYLEFAGHTKIITYNCPTQALHAVVQGLIPSCIITDFRMPGMNGIQLLEAVSMVLPEIPIIIMTGDPDMVLDFAAKYPIIEKGCINFFQKLLHHVNQMTNNNKAARSVRNRNNHRNFSHLKTMRKPAMKNNAVSWQVN